MKFALLFPGQGAQFVGMGKELASLPEGKSRFEEADRILGFSLSQLCWEGPLETLTRTQNCQPALYVASMAALAVLEKKAQEKGIAFQPTAAAGLSLGEYTALAAAGAFSFADGLRLVQLRAQAMEEAAKVSQGTMASVIGLELEPLESICAATGAQVANINAPGQIVISGAPMAVQAASEKAKASGAKRVVELSVGGAFHSRLMEPASRQLEGALQKVSIQAPRFPVLSNVTAQPHTTPEAIRQLLVEQLTHPVRWEACCRKAVAMGIQTFLEAGPGTVLKGLMKRIDPAVTVLSAGSPGEIEQLLAQWA